MQLWVVMVLLILLGLPRLAVCLTNETYKAGSNGTFNFTWTASLSTFI